MEAFFNISLVIHASFGGIALAVGLIAILAKKGLKVHKVSGKIFYYSMIISAITAMTIAFMPGHLSLFLFAVGIFSLYLVLSGYRALKFKLKDHNFALDKIISIVMLVSGLAMILLPLIIFQRIHIVLAVFGAVGLLFSIQDLVRFRNPQKLRKSWLLIHLGRILGGYISAVTAFVVVNQFLPGIFGWLAPGVAGGVLITFWSRKYQPEKTA